MLSDRGQFPRADYVNDVVAFSMQDFVGILDVLQRVVEVRAIEKIVLLEAPCLLDLKAVPAGCFQEL